MIAAAGDIKSIHLSHLQELHGKVSKLRLPHAQVSSGGSKFVVQKNLEGAAVSIASVLDSSSATVAPVIIGILKALWNDANQRQEDAPSMAQQLWVSLVSHKSSNEYAAAVETFLDQHLDYAAEVMKWKDHSGRTAAAIKLRLPPAQVCIDGIEAIKKFFFNPEHKELEGAALEITSQLDSSIYSAADVIDMVNALWSEDHEAAPAMAQQLQRCSRTL
jgi:hypothetical protein